MNLVDEIDDDDDDSDYNFVSVSTTFQRGVKTNSNHVL